MRFLFFWPQRGQKGHPRDDPRGSSVRATRQFIPDAVHLPLQGGDRRVESVAVNRQLNGGGEVGAQGVRRRQALRAIPVV